MNKFDKIYRSIINESRLATDFDDKRFRYNGNFWVAELERDQTAKGNGFYQAELYLIVWKDEVEWEIRDYNDLFDDGLGLRIDGYGAHSFKYNTLMERNKKIDRLYQKFVNNFNAIDIEQKKKEKKLEDLYNSFVEESVEDFNYQEQLERFERQIGDWEPLDGWQWSNEGLDENQNEFEETFLSYNGQVQVYLKEDGRIDVIDPDKKHKLFKRGDYQRAKKYITSIFKVLNQADRMRWS